MATNSILDICTKIKAIKEQIEGELVAIDKYFFKKVEFPLMSKRSTFDANDPLMSDKPTFDANDPPANPLVFSQTHRLIFAAHRFGFFVTKVDTALAAEREIRREGSGPSIQELSVVDVRIGKVSILALSMDSSHVAAIVGADMQCFSVMSLLHKDYKPSFCCSVKSNHVKDMLWINNPRSSFIVLTNDRTLHFGSLNKSLKHVMDGVDAVGRSVDGNQIAVGRKNLLSIFSSNFEEISQVLHPMDIWMGESDTVRVDGIKWVRSDSIVVGFFKQDEYFIQVIKNKHGQIIDDSAKLTSIDFSYLLTRIVDGAPKRPHLFVNYCENCGFAFVSSWKNMDQRIMLFDWAREDNLVSVVDIERENFLPRIELQESGDENFILGLCVDDGLPPPSTLLMCLTLEGKLIMFENSTVQSEVQ